MSEIEQGIASEVIPDEMPRIGDFLKNQRTQRGIELKFISQRTKINLPILQHLEENKLFLLPSRTYVKGFVQQYAREIGIDAVEALKSLERTYQEIENGTLKPTQSHLDTTSDQNHLNRHYSKNKKNISGVFSNNIDIDDDFFYLKNFLNRKVMAAMIVLSFCLVLVGALVIRNLPKNFSSHLAASNKTTKKILPSSLTSLTETLPTDPAAKPTQPTPALSGTANTTTATTPTTKPPTLPIQNKVVVPSTSTPVTKTLPQALPQPIPVKPVTPVAVAPIANTQKLTPPPSPTIPAPVPQTPAPLPANLKLEKAVNFDPLPKDLFSVKTNAAESTDENIFPTNYRSAHSPSVANRQTVFVNAFNEDTWVTYRTDNGPVKSYLMAKGKKLLLRGSEIVFFLGNPKAVKLFYNNQFIDTAATSASRSYVFPKEKNAEYASPLFIKTTSGQIITSKDYRKNQNN